MTNTEDKLATVHDAMSESVFSPEDEAIEQFTVVQTFRLPPDLKERVRMICEANGTKPSKWLRECCEKLVNDYR